MRTFLFLFFSGVLLIGSGSGLAQQRTEQPPNLPIPIPPRAQQRTFPRLPVPDRPRSEDGRRVHAKGKTKVKGWQRPGHPGRGHAYGRGKAKKGERRMETRRRRPTVSGRYPDRQPRRLPRRSGSTG